MSTYLSVIATAERRERLKPVLSSLKQQLRSHIANSNRRLVKIGGQGDGKARWESAHYPEEFFDCDEAIQFEAKISSKADGIYLETEMINYAKFNLRVGVNFNGVAVLNGGAEYSDEKPGSIYMVPVKSTIRTQAEFNSTYQSYYMKTKGPGFETPELSLFQF